MMVQIDPRPLHQPLPRRRRRLMKYSKFCAAGAALFIEPHRGAGFLRQRAKRVVKGTRAKR